MLRANTRLTYPVLLSKPNLIQSIDRATRTVGTGGFLNVHPRHSRAAVSGLGRTWADDGEDSLSLFLFSAVDLQRKPVQRKGRLSEP